MFLVRYPGAARWLRLGLLAVLATVACGCTPALLPLSMVAYSAMQQPDDRERERAVLDPDARLDKVDVGITLDPANRRSPVQVRAHHALLDAAADPGADRTGTWGPPGIAGISPFAGMGLVPPAADSSRLTRAEGVPEDAVIQDVGDAEIRFEGPSLEALVRRSRPQAVWNSRDFLWRTDDGFVFNRAYHLQVRGQPGRWVLLKGDEAAAMRRGEFRRVDAPLVKDKPGHDGGDGNYARVAARAESGQRLYEVGWECGPAGQGMHLVGRRIYVLEDAAGRYAVIGEGPAEGRGRCGGDRYEQRHDDLHVTWTGRTDAPVSLRFTVRQTQRQQDGPEGGPTRPQVVCYQDWTLEGGSGGPARLKADGPAYVRAGEMEDLSDIAQRLAQWTPGYGNQAADATTQPADRECAERQAASRLAWRNELARLNPRWKGDRLPEGVRVLLPSERQVEEALNPRQAAVRP